MSYWYNISTGQVETDDNRGQDEDVLGPYESEDAARKALETARARTEDWDAQDRAWNEQNAAPGWDEEKHDG